MLFIIGAGHRTVKSYGSVNKMMCIRCKYMTAREILKVTSWMTLFYVPVIPYKKQYLLICPVCNAAYEMDKADFDRLTDCGRAESITYNSIPRSRNTQAVQNNRYADKTPTQIEYLKQVEEYEKNKDCR